MKRFLSLIAALLGLAAPVHAQGTLPIAMNVQQDANGRPLSGALLYTYVIGTLATPQVAFQDIALTQALPWPVQADLNGRLPMFYLPSGSVHARLTDAAGGIQFDYPNVLVIGGAGAGGGGGGGGGPTVDPSAIASTGDVKWRPSEEVLDGWVVLNGLTLGDSTSGATGFKDDKKALSLFLYLWTNCPNTVCPVTPNGRGATALADFNAHKQIKLIDMRGSMMAGRDCMGTTCADRIPSSVVIGGGRDIAQSRGGAATQTIKLATLPTLDLPVSTPIPALTVGITSVNVSGANHSHNVTGGVNGGSTSTFVTYGTGGSSQFFATPATTITISNSNTLSMSCSGTGCGSGATNATTVTTNNTAKLSGGGNALTTMNPFVLGTFYAKL